MTPAPRQTQSISSDDGAESVASTETREKEFALVLPLIGLALFSPPLIGLFARDIFIFGAPMIVAYIFFVWIALICAARWISRRLMRGVRPQ